jgi:hypothetical protein
VQVEADDPALPANDGGAVHLAALPVPHPLRENNYDISPLFRACSASHTNCTLTAVTAVTAMLHQSTPRRAWISFA